MIGRVLRVSIADIHTIGAVESIAHVDLGGAMAPVRNSAGAIQATCYGRGDLPIHGRNLILGRLASTVFPRRKDASDVEQATRL
jgi:hypothetical protein